MPTYVATIEFTDPGVAHVGDTTRRADAFRAEAEQMGVQVRELFWMLGPVDGLVVFDAPDEETARKYGLHYVHVPMDYEGISPAQRENILGAFSGTSDPVYIHCNSGRNRGATAAAMCLIGVEGKSNEEAISWMETRGVDPKNQKLYDAVQNYQPEP